MEQKTTAKWYAVVPLDARPIDENGGTLSLVNSSEHPKSTTFIMAFVDVVQLSIRFSGLSYRRDIKSVR